MEREEAVRTHLPARASSKLAVLLAVFLMLALAACEADDADEVAEETDDDTEETPDDDPDPEPDDDAEDEPEDVDFPTGDVTIHVGAGPGSTMDFLARGFQPHLEEVWGVNVIVENTTGANQANAYTEVANAEGDGHTLIIGVGNTFGILDAFGNVDTPTSEMAWIGNLIEEPYTWFVSADSGIESIDDFVDAAPIRYGDSGVDSPLHPFALDFFDAYDMDFVFTPGYDAGEISGLLQTGEQDAIARGPAFFVRQGMADEATAIVQGSDEPHPVLPDVPTYGQLAEEEGLTELEPKFVYQLNFVIGASPGTPQDVQDKIAADIRDLIETNDEVQAWMEENMIEHDMHAENVDAVATQELMAELMAEFEAANITEVEERLN